MSKFTEGKGAIYSETVDITLSTLAAKDVISAATKQDGSRAQGFRFLKSEVFVAANGLAAGEYIMVGLSGPTMDAVEVEEAIEADPQSPDDRSPVEHAMRPYWPLCILGGEANSGGMTIWQGEWKPRWSFTESVALSVWVYNLTTGALTTGCVVNVFMKHFGVWLND